MNLFEGRIVLLVKEQIAKIRTSTQYQEQTSVQSQRARLDIIVVSCCIIYLFVMQMSGQGCSAKMLAIFQETVLEILRILFFHLRKAVELRRNTVPGGAQSATSCR